jgi:hydroxylaminobenzene mutase
MQERGRRLLWHGMVLFVLGLLTGLIQQHLRNPRMGLAAHLEGIMNGTFLLALGAAWPQVRLSPRLNAVAYWTALCGTYGNWAVTIMAAVFGTAAMTPIAGSGYSGQRWQEAVVTLGFVSIGIAVLIASLLLLHGFRRQR